jgi:hypothetical protein
MREIDAFVNPFHPDACRDPGATLCLIVGSDENPEHLFSSKDRHSNAFSPVAPIDFRQALNRSLTMI